MCPRTISKSPSCRFPRIRRPNAIDCSRIRGIRGILNFTPVELKTSTNCIIHNINIGVEIENLFFQVIKNGLPLNLQLAESVDSEDDSE